MKEMQIVVRVPCELMDQIDKHARELNNILPELRVTRSAAARDLLRRALRSLAERSAA